MLRVGICVVTCLSRGSPLRYTHRLSAYSVISSSNSYHFSIFIP